MGAEKKERVLHARIPAALEDQIKRLADSLRVPVSNLVRNMLEDAIDVTRRMAGESLAGVYGWQELVLNIEVPCAMCQRPLHSGESAYVGLSHSTRDAKHFICPVCLPRKGASNGRQS
jgi:hypothetical protein